MTRHAREDAPALGRLADAERDSLVRGHAGDVATVERDRGPADTGRTPEIVFERRGLAGAVGADERDDLALVDRERQSP